jgi:hypothetical protein
VNPIIALVIWFLLSTVPQAFSSPEKSLQTVHARFSGMFLAQLVIQLLIAVDVLGLSVF